MKILLVATFLSLLGGGSAVAQNLCPGLTGQARTSCLQAEAARARENVARANANNARLDVARGVVCTERQVGGALATGVGRAEGGIAGGVAANGAYRAGTATMDRALGNPRACINRAR